MMAKLPPTDSPMADWWSAMKLQARETDFYSKLLPALNEEGDKSPLEFAKYYVNNVLKRYLKPYSRYYHVESNGILIMEDLKESGFAMRDAKLSLDLDHMNVKQADVSV